MKVQTARFIRRVNVFGANLDRYDAATTRAKDVQVIAGDRGIQFMRERTVDGEIITERANIPWAHVTDWTAIERRPVNAGAKK